MRKTLLALLLPFFLLPFLFVKKEMAFCSIPGFRSCQGLAYFSGSQHHRDSSLSSDVDAGSSPDCRGRGLESFPAACPLHPSRRDHLDASQGLWILKGMEPQRKL